MIDAPYKGAATVYPDLMNGTVAVMLDNPSGSAGLVRENRLTGFAVTRPSAALPDVPTFDSLGVKNFDDLPLHPRILDAIAKIGWKEPTPVQKLCLPFSLRGRDVAGFAQTGTGKTAVFLLNVLAFVFMVVIIGGLGSIKGTLVSSFLVGQVVSLGSLIYAPLAQTAPFAIMLLILLVRPRGLFGSRLLNR